RPRGNPPITTREKLYIAGSGGSRKGLGCVLALLVAVAAAFAVDFFLVYPNRELRCGHEGKESYFFGALPLGHSCEGLEAIRYMDSAREAFLDTPNMAPDMEVIQTRADLGEPPASYGFSAFEDGTFTAEADVGSGLASYTMGPDGTVTRD
ncbi:MAG: hypothetical protein ACYTKD_19240, partial [Planctomycetota bacterium]